MEGPLRRKGPFLLEIVRTASAHADVYLCRVLPFRQHVNRRHRRLPKAWETDIRGGHDDGCLNATSLIVHPILNGQNLKSLYYNTTNIVDIGYFQA
jgi:hypothetical protein